MALTFDDGPVRDTQRLLDLLNADDAGARFHALGTNVQKNPSTVKAAAQAGHQMGNHSWDHADLTKPSTARIQSQFSRTDTAIEKATGEKPTTVRAPRLRPAHQVRRRGDQAR